MYIIYRNCLLSGQYRRKSSIFLTTLYLELLSISNKKLGPLDEKLTKKKLRFAEKTKRTFIRYRKLASLRRESKFSWNVERWKNTKKLSYSYEYIFS